MLAIFINWQVCDLACDTNQEQHRPLPRTWPVWWLGEFYQELANVCGGCGNGNAPWVVWNTTESKQNLKVKPNWNFSLFAADMAPT